MPCDVGDSKKGRKSNRIGKSKVVPKELHPHNVLISIELSGDCSKKANSSAADSSVRKETDSIEMDCTGKKSGPSSKFTGLDDVKPNPVFLSSCVQIKLSSGGPEDPVTILNSDETDERPKVKCSPPLITFSRRAKKKREGSGIFAEQNSNSVGKYCTSSSRRGQITEESCRHSCSSPACRSIDYSASAVMLLEQAEVTH